MKRLLELIRWLFSPPVPDSTEAQMEALRVALERQIEADEAARRRDHG